MVDICIIGAGIAGLTAALYAHRAGLTTVVLEKNIYGGQMTESAEIENYPCVPHTDGVTLANAVYEQATAQGAEVLFEEALSIECCEKIWKITTNAAVHEAKTVIYANGVKRRLLGCDGEARLSGRGVSYCATCDGAFYRKKTTVVVGGGNTALEDALFLSNMCEKVYLIHRRNAFRGEKILADAVRQRENIELVLEAQVERITGENNVDGVDVIFNDGTKKHFETNGVFVAVGLIPDNSLIKGIAEIDEAGYIIAEETGKTSCEGLFAAGDCRTKALRQIVTAASDGANAATSAFEYISRL